MENRWLWTPALALTAVALASCGDDRSSGGAPQQQRDGRLVIRESLPPMPRYVEGSLSFLHVEASGGGVVLADGPATDGVQVRGRDPLLSRTVAPGRYRVVSFQRPCDGNCEVLDQPVDRCEATVRVHEGQTLTVTILLGQNGGCTVRAESSSTRLPPPSPSALMAAHRENRRWARSHLPGMPEARAGAAVRARGLELRIVRRDGRGLVVTGDRVPTRVNVEVRSGSVTRVVGLY